MNEAAWRGLLIGLAGMLCAAQAPAAAPDEPTVLNLSATATLGIVPDRLTATMSVSMLAASPALVSAAVNRAIAGARQDAAEFPAVRLEAQAYQVTRREPPDQRWQGEQVVRLTALDGSDSVLRLVGVLQARNLATEDVGWQVAPEVLETRKQQAVQAALKSLRGQAEQDAAALGLKLRRFRLVSIDEGFGRPVPMMRSIAASAAAAPQADRPADAAVSATVHGEAVLAPP